MHTDVIYCLVESCTPSSPPALAAVPPRHPSKPPSTPPQIDILNTEAHNTRLLETLRLLNEELQEKAHAIEKYEVEIRRRNDEVEKKTREIDLLNRCVRRSRFRCPVRCALRSEGVSANTGRSGGAVGVLGVVRQGSGFRTTGPPIPIAPPHRTCLGVCAATHRVRVDGHSVL